MKSSRLVSLVVTCAALSVLAVSLWLLRTSPEALAERERDAVLSAGAGAATELAPRPAVSVDSLVVRPVAARAVIEVAGVLEPVRSVALGVEVAGMVVEVAVEEHAAVEKGALLVRLDQALPRVALEQAQAAQQVAQATLGQARSELRRQKDLAQRGVASEVELERVQTDYSRATAELASARAQVLEAQTRLDKTHITAPFASVITVMDLEPGSYLMPGQTVAELVDIAELEIEIGVPDREVGALREGQEVSVRVDVLPGESFPGVVYKVGRAPDARTQRYPVPVRLKNPDTRLLPGMLATVRFEVGGERETLRVPRRAVQTEFELDYLFEIVPNAEDGEGDGGRVMRRRVTTRRVPFRPDLIDIESGLRGNERIAVTGIADLRDGMSVRFRDREVTM